MHFLDDRDLNRADQLDLLDTTWRLKHEGFDLGAPLAGKTVAMVMSKPSLRTRTSFTVATRRLGGEILEIGAHNTKLGKGEDMEEWAAVLTSMVDGIGARVHGHEDLEALAKFGSKPVVNLLSDKLHPLQSLCDAYTVFESAKKQGLANSGSAAEYFGTSRKWAYLGDGNNIIHSMMLVAASLGVIIHAACPEGRAPDPALVKAARDLHPAGADGVRVDHDANAAAADADMISTDTWVSMGQEGAMDRDAVRALFGPFQVDAARMALGKPGAVFMHCLPAVPGEEMTAEVLRGPQSIILEQAENRLWTVQTLLARKIFG